MSEIVAALRKKSNSLNLTPLLSRHKNLILYFIFGCMAASTDLGLYLVLFNLVSVPAVLSTIISISAATIVGFILNVAYNYKVSDKLLLRLIAYSSVSFVGMCLSAVILYIFHDLYGFDGNLIKTLTLPLIFLVQYTLNKSISFKKWDITMTDN